MKFHRVGFVINFHSAILRTSKSIGNNTMKKMLLATALALLITGCAQQTFTVQNKPAAVAPRKPSPIISSFLELGRRKLSMQPKFVAAQKMLKQKLTNIRKWIARFYYFRHLYSAGSACVLLTIIAWICPSIWATLSTCSLIYFWVPFQLFLHSDQPLSEGEIIPFSSVCQSGRLHYPRRRRW